MHKNVGSHPVGNGGPLKGFKEGHDQFSKEIRGLGWRGSGRVCGGEKVCSESS